MSGFAIGRQVVLLSGNDQEGGSRVRQRESAGEGLPVMHQWDAGGCGGPLQDRAAR